MSKKLVPRLRLKFILQFTNLSLNCLTDKKLILAKFCLLLRIYMKIFQDHHFFHLRYIERSLYPPFFLRYSLPL